MAELGFILLAEDEEHDVFFIRRAFEKVGVPNPLFVVRDGQEAIEYLSGVGRFADRRHFRLPCILLTDLKMPRTNGFELLEWMQGQPQLHDTPRIVLSSSAQDSDRKRAFELGACAYFTKPSNHAELQHLVRALYQDYLLPHCAGEEIRTAAD